MVRWRNTSHDGEFPLLSVLWHRLRITVTTSTLKCVRYQLNKSIAKRVEIIRLLCFIFQTLDEWSFDVFALSDAASSQPIKYLGYDLLNRYGMIHKFKVNPSENCYFYLRFSYEYWVSFLQNFTTALNENFKINHLFLCYVVASLTYTYISTDVLIFNFSCKFKIFEWT